jgi:tRNA(fMet)-specific endonuclease VapC
MTAFDTDVLSDTLRGVPALVARAVLIATAEQAVPIIVIEEIIRGRFAVIRQAEAGKGKVDLPQAYDLLDESFHALAAIQTLLYTAAAETLFQTFRKAKIRVGTRDVRIAAICIDQGATLVTRNARDYTLIPGLKLDVWT